MDGYLGSIHEIIKDAEGRADSLAESIIRSADERGLSLEEAGALLSAKDPFVINALYKKASEVKERVFGKRVVLFAPLYLSSHCTNNCVYCGFRSDEKALPRRALTVSEAVKEAGALSDMGFKRTLLVLGEDRRWGVDYIRRCVEAIYESTGMRIAHLNAPPTDVASFKALKASGIGVYQCFQETYHRETYAVMHPKGRKRDYDFRLSVMDRAIDAGIEDVGIGPLIGLYDFRFDCLAVIAHSNYLLRQFGTHAHTISVPRLRPIPTAPLKEVPHPMTDDDLKKIVAVFRLSVPSAGIVVSTRESALLRRELLHIGASQMSAASRTDPGGYTKEGGSTLTQFSTSDEQTLDEVMEMVALEGYVPSLCTTCYRVGRVGNAFHEKTLSGGMERFCGANAILTLKEYLGDGHANGSRDVLLHALSSAVSDIKDEDMKKAIVERLERIEKGERDIYL